MKYYNIVQVVPNYYGEGNAATFYLMRLHRYTNETVLTSDVCSAGLYSLSDAEELAKQISNNVIHYEIRECPADVEHNLRCCFV